MHLITPAGDQEFRKQYLQQIKDLQKFDLKVPKKEERKLSPLLEKEEKQAVWNLGQSLDSKKITSALGYLDLKQICYCLA